MDQRPNSNHVVRFVYLVKHVAEERCIKGQTSSIISIISTGNEASIIHRQEIEREREGGAGGGSQSPASLIALFLSVSG